MITALLSWYDEPADLLAETVESWGKLCDAVVAVDGAFAEYPEGVPSSPSVQAAAIRQAAKRSGMQALVYEPSRLWRDQPEKRTWAWRLGEALTATSDWFFVVDADEELDENYSGYLSGDAANVTVEIDGNPLQQPRLLRAYRGVAVHDLHYRYRLPNGTFLWNYPGEPAVEATGIEIRLRHRRAERPPERLRRQDDYYRNRAERLEVG